ncbi:LOW QUALITY PROTEIN: transcriptional activator MN1 [Chanos chanos]|uniref:LOW QUALITY PROTEIN: transcriptional activator MN1 n=1 Tax=Chanos chanos TaxID=29144 RepID=A0A6J2UX50_CHACN|nr:LOW QUALITY PROTEIN: transcriptional activator MN1-like [Chanos chanos]
MNSKYNSPGFHVKAPTFGVEPVLGPLNESPMQGFNFSKEQYGYQHHGHGDMIGMGIQQQHQFQINTSFNGQQPNHEQSLHPYQDNAHSVASCLHGDRHMGFNSSNAGHQHVFEPGFGPLSEGQGRECIPQQQQRIATMPEFQPHGHPNGNHAVPAPCLPLDQSPNRAASFHGLPSSSPETHRLEHYRLFPQGRMGPGSEYCFPCDPLPGNFDMSGFSAPDSAAEQKLSHCEMGNQVVGGNFPTFNHNSSRASMVSNSKDDQQLPQQNAYSDRFGNRGKTCGVMEPGVISRHHFMLQQRPGSIPRQNPGSPALPRLYHAPDYGSGNPDMQNGGVMIHSQHGHLDHPAHKLNNHSMPPYGDHMFGVPPLTHQHAHPQQHFGSVPYLNAAKRPRFDLPNGRVGESCSPLNSSLHNRPSLENHLSPSGYPAPVGEFSAHVTDGFPTGPPLLNTGPHQPQHALQRQQNAAMMIKQMASRNQQQRMKQPDFQQLTHHGDIAANGMVHRGPVSNGCQSGFEKKHGFHGNFDTQSPHLPQENSWFPEANQQCREASIHSVEHSQNGHSIIFRPGISPMDLQKPAGVSQEGFVKSLNSPGVHAQFDNVGNPLQIQPPGDGPMPPNAPVDRRVPDFNGAPMRRQHNFPPRGPSQQGAPQSNPAGFSTSPENYPPHPEFLSSQHLSVNKLGALSLGTLNKASTKDSVFGQSCLAALSTACQNMIASLGAPNLNVTFNKRSQNEAKRKPGQVEQQDVNSSGGGGPGGPGAEYIQSNASQNSQTSCSGNSNNTSAGQGGMSQMAKGEVSTLSPNNNNNNNNNSNNNMDSGNEGKTATGGGRGRGKRRRDSGHISPGNFSPSCSSHPVVSPSQQGCASVEGSNKTPDRSLLSPSFGKPDLTTSIDSGIQSVGKSDGVSPCVDYLDEASPNYSSEDARNSRSNAKCKSDNRAGYSDASCVEHVCTPLTSSGQDEVHPLEILQAQIQLQRQQFSISEDQPLGGRSSKKADFQAGQNGECALANHSPDAGKSSMNTIDLDSLLTEQHATWYAPGNKTLIEEPGNDKCMAFWDRARGQNDNKEGKLNRLAVRA